MMQPDIALVYEISKNKLPLQKTTWCSLSIFSVPISRGLRRSLSQLPSSPHPPVSVINTQATLFLETHQSCLPGNQVDNPHCPSVFQFPFPRLILRLIPSLASDHLQGSIFPLFFLSLLTPQVPLEDTFPTSLSLSAFWPLQSFLNPPCQLQISRYKLFQGLLPKWLYLSGTEKHFFNQPTATTHF